jgi:hypothetical protein
LDIFGTPLVIEPWPGQLFHNTGLPPFSQLDQRIGRSRTETRTGRKQGRS